MQRANDKPCSVKLHDMLVLDSSNSANGWAIHLHVFRHKKCFGPQQSGM